MGDRVDGGVGEHALSVSSALAKIVALGLPKKKIRILVFNADMP